MLASLQRRWGPALWPCAKPRGFICPKQRDEVLNINVRYIRAATTQAVPTKDPPQACDAEHAELDPPVRCLTIITGASRGLGAAIARSFFHNGPPLRELQLARPRAGPHPTAAQHDAQHDLLLLASDPSRLEAFAGGALVAPLEPCEVPRLRRQQPGASAAAAAGQGAAAGRGGIATGAAAAAGCGPGPGPCPRVPTRVLCAALDLGDLDALEGHVALMLGPEQEEGQGQEEGEGSGAGPIRQWQRGQADQQQQRAGVEHRLGPRPLLPRPLSHYTHVLLVHNAGQVGPGPAGRAGANERCAPASSLASVDPYVYNLACALQVNATDPHCRLAALR